MIVAVHQPEYLPHLGLLDKARRADVLVLLNDVQFKRDSLQQRAKIACPRRGWRWLTIPFVHAHPQLVRDVRPTGPEWQAQHPALIRESYAGAPALDLVMRQLSRFYDCPWGDVSGAASGSMLLLFEAFGVKARTWPSSEVKAEGDRGARVLDICRRMGATTYISGRSGAEYLDREAFAAAGIEVEVQQFTVPRYREGQPDVPCLSALDAWMYLGDEVSGIL